VFIPAPRDGTNLQPEVPQQPTHRHFQGDHTLLDGLSAQSEIWGLPGTLHLPSFHQDDIQACYTQPTMQPLRQGASLKADGGNSAVLLLGPMHQFFSFACDLRLFHDLAILADHANRSLCQRYIQPNKQSHPVALHVDPIRDGRQIAPDLASGNRQCAPNRTGKPVCLQLDNPAPTWVSIPPALSAIAIRLQSALSWHKVKADQRGKSYKRE
jgi:hypothetical protein